MSAHHCPNPCPNCGGPGGALVSHNCVPAGYHDAPTWLSGTKHCGCFYEADPSRVRYHATRDCVCGEELAP